MDCNCNIISAPGEDPFKGSTGKDSTQKKKDKKPKQKQNNNNKKAAPAAADPNLPDICKLEFKVGVITKVWVHPEADKLYCEEIDVGEEDGPRQIASGLRAHYSEEEMLGKRVLVVANLKVSRFYRFIVYGLYHIMTLKRINIVLGKEISRLQIAWNGTLCSSKQ